MPPPSCMRRPLLPSTSAPKCRSGSSTPRDWRPGFPPDAQAWPLPLAVAEGELWLAVDDHDLAEAAFARELARRTSGAALRGVARSRSRRGDMAGACAPFRQALALVEVERPEGSLAVEARAFLRLCP